MSILFQRDTDRSDSLNGYRPAPHAGGGDVAGRRYNCLMEILLNGEARDVPEPTTVLALLEATGLVERRVAVEVNREIVPRSVHGERFLVEGDRVEIVHAIGGG